MSQTADSNLPHFSFCSKDPSNLAVCTRHLPSVDVVVGVTPDGSPHFPDSTTQNQPLRSPVELNNLFEELEVDPRITAALLDDSDQAKKTQRARSRYVQLRREQPAETSPVPRRVTFTKVAASNTKKMIDLHPIKQRHDPDDVMAIKMVDGPVVSPLSPTAGSQPVPMTTSTTADDDDEGWIDVSSAKGTPTPVTPAAPSRTLTPPAVVGEPLSRVETTASIVPPAILRAPAYPATPCNENQVEPAQAQPRDMLPSLFGSPVRSSGGMTPKTLAPILDAGVSLNLTGGETPHFDASSFFTNTQSFDSTGATNPADAVLLGAPLDFSQLDFGNHQEFDSPSPVTGRAQRESPDAYVQVDGSQLPRPEFSPNAKRPASSMEKEEAQDRPKRRKRRSHLTTKKYAKRPKKSLLQSIAPADPDLSAMQIDPDETRLYLESPPPSVPAPVNPPAPVPRMLVPVNTAVCPPSIRELQRQVVQVRGDVYGESNAITEAAATVMTAVQDPQPNSTLQIVAGMHTLASLALDRDLNQTHGELKGSFGDISESFKKAREDLIEFSKPVMKHLNQAIQSNKLVALFMNRDLHVLFAFQLLSEQQVACLQGLCFVEEPDSGCFRLSWVPRRDRVSLKFVGIRDIQLLQVDGPRQVSVADIDQAGITLRLEPYVTLVSSDDKIFVFFGLKHRDSQGKSTMAWFLHYATVQVPETADGIAHLFYQKLPNTIADLRREAMLSSFSSTSRWVFLVSSAIPVFGIAPFVLSYNDVFLFNNPVSLMRGIQRVYGLMTLDSFSVQDETARRSISLYDKQKRWHVTYAHAWTFCCGEDAQEYALFSSRVDTEDMSPIAPPILIGKLLPRSGLLRLVGSEPNFVIDGDETIWTVSTLPSTQVQQMPFFATQVSRGSIASWCFTEVFHTSNTLFGTKTFGLEVVFHVLSDDTTKKSTQQVMIFDKVVATPCPHVYEVQKNAESHDKVLLALPFPFFDVDRFGELVSDFKASSLEAIYQAVVTPGPLQAFDALMRELREIQFSEMPPRHECRVRTVVSFEDEQPRVIRSQRALQQAIETYGATSEDSPVEVVRPVVSVSDPLVTSEQPASRPTARSPIAPFPRLSLVKARTLTRLLIDAVSELYDIETAQTFIHDQVDAFNADHPGSQLTAELYLGKARMRKEFQGAYHDFLIFCQKKLQILVDEWCQLHRNLGDLVEVVGDLSYLTFRAINLHILTSTGKDASARIRMQSLAEDAGTILCVADFDPMKPYDASTNYMTRGWLYLQPNVWILKRYRQLGFGTKNISVDKEQFQEVVRVIWNHYEEHHVLGPAATLQDAHFQEQTPQSNTVTLPRSLRRRGQAHHTSTQPTRQGPSSLEQFKTWPLLPLDVDATVILPFTATANAIQSALDRLGDLPRNAAPHVDRMLTEKFSLPQRPVEFQPLALAD